MRDHHCHCALVALVVATLMPVALSPTAGALAKSCDRGMPTIQSWVVTSTADVGAGSLRQVLVSAAAGDSISFDPAVFPPEAPVAILPTSPLPTITQNRLTLDASNAGVILDGSLVSGDVFFGLGIEADGVTVRGLQILDFAGNGIELRGQNNTIGGNRQIGAGPVGQANLLSRNQHSGITLLDSGTISNTIQGNLIGVDPTGTLDWGNAGDGIGLNGANHNLVADNVIGWNAMGVQGCCSTDTSHNVIRDNRIGVGPDGSTPIPNRMNGVWLHDGASNNMIGPGNLIAYNLSAGIIMHTATSQGNTITGNHIFGNADGIVLVDGSNGDLGAPVITAFDMPNGVVVGESCPACRVEIFSDQGDQGQAYEGAVVVDVFGGFSFQKGAAFVNLHLTATATDAAGNTSPFSMYTTGSGAEWILQSGNTGYISLFPHLPASQLAENHLSGGSATPHQHGGNFQEFLEWLGKEQLAQGLKCLHISLNEVEEPIDWSRSEYLIEQQDDDWIDVLNENGVSIAYGLNFWDKANHSSGWPPITSRFTTEEDIQRYLEYVHFVVSHFKGRVAIYDLWNEPDNLGSRIQYIEPRDFIELIRRTVPVIRAADPDAKIMVGSVSYLRDSFARNYLYSILRSDILPLVDVIAWHPMYGTSPEFEQDREYYYEYPAIVKDIQRTATANGFRGSYRADEIYWRSPDCLGCNPSLPMHTDITAAKYLGRGAITQLGLGVDAGGGVSVTRLPSFAVMANLGTLFSGYEAAAFQLDLGAPITNVVSYAFAGFDGSRMVALWNDGVAADEDAGTSVTLTLPGFAGHAAVGVDPLHSLEQPLVAEEIGQALVIRDLRIKDYPLLVRLAPERRLYLPIIPK